MRCVVIEGILHPIATVSHLMGFLFVPVKKIISIFQSVLGCICCCCPCHYRNSKTLTGRITLLSSDTSQPIPSATTILQGRQLETKPPTSAQPSVTTLSSADQPAQGTEHTTQTSTLAEPLAQSSVTTLTEAKPLKPSQSAEQPTSLSTPAEPSAQPSVTTLTEAKPLAQSSDQAPPEVKPPTLSPPAEQPTLSAPPAASKQPPELPEEVLSKQKELFEKYFTTGDALMQWSECLKQHNIPFFIPDTATKIDLSKFECPPEFFDQICDACFPFIQSLTLGDCQWVTDDHIARISRSQQLESLDLYRCQKITRRGLTFILKLPKLTSLDVGMCDQLSIRDLPELPQLKSLSCWRNITDDELERVTQLFPQLESLNINFCSKFTHNGLKIISKFTKLVSLSLYSCSQLTTFNFSELSQLKSLDLSCCLITNDDLKNLLRLTKLEKLAVDFCHNITKEGLRQLLSHPSLQQISCYECGGITTHGCRPLKEILDTSS